MPWQKRMLGAASFGMHFSYRGAGGNAEPHPPGDGPGEMAQEFVEGARAVRVLNALRAPGVGMALTAGQYEALTPTGVVKRLIRYGRPGLATRVCAYLRLEDEVCAMARCARATAVLAAASGKDYSEADTIEINARVHSLSTLLYLSHVETELLNWK